MAAKEDQVKQQALLDAVKKNAKSVAAGVNNPAFEGLPELADDPTNPLNNLADTAHRLAAQITNQKLKGDGSSQHGNKTKLDKEGIKKLALEVAAKLGMILSAAMLEDLQNIAAGGEPNLNDRDIWLYLKGAMRANQISSVTALSKIVTNLETVLKANQQAMLSNADANKIMSERLTLVGTKIDNISPSISSIIQSEHGYTRAAINNLQISPNPQSTKYTVEKPESSSTPQNGCPGLSEIKQMCLIAKMPEKIADQYAPSCVGRATWDDYQKITSGALAPKAISALVRSWKPTI